MSHDCRKIIVFKNQRELASYAVKKWQKLAQENINKKKCFVVALSGGKTPVNFYRHLAASVKNVLWQKTHVFIVDERFVSFSNSKSNFRMIRKNLLDKIKIPLSNIHPILTDRQSLHSATKQYEKDLISFFKLSGSKLPKFDLIVLGIGEDGHTASLFSRRQIKQAKNRLVAPALISKRKSKRITVTLPVINNAENIFFLVMGKNKATALKNVWAGDKRLPASLVEPKRGQVSFFVDQPAAVGLLCCCMSNYSGLR